MSVEATLHSLTPFSASFLTMGCGMSHQANCCRCKESVENQKTRQQEFMIKENNIEYTS